MTCRKLWYVLQMCDQDALPYKVYMSINASNVWCMDMLAMFTRLIGEGTHTHTLTTEHERPDIVAELHTHTHIHVHTHTHAHTL